MQHNYNWTEAIGEAGCSMIGNHENIKSNNKSVNDNNNNDNNVLGAEDIVYIGSLFKRWRSKELEEGDKKKQGRNNFSNKYDAK